MKEKGKLFFIAIAKQLLFFPQAFAKQKAVAVAFLLLIGYCCAVEIEDTTPIQSVKATVTLSGGGEITGDLQGMNAEIRLFSFMENSNQEILSQQETLSINGRTIYAAREQDGQGNNYAVFAVNETGAFTYKIEALVETNYLPLDLQEYDLSNKISQFAEFVAPTEKVESNSEQIRTIALNNFDSNSWLQTVRDVTSWVHGYVTYDKSYYPAIKSAVETLDERRGTCDEFSVLAAAMLRARGIPVRFASGVSFGEGSWENHAWIEAFNPESGWIAIDPTFGEAGLIDGAHFFIGNFSDPTGAVEKITSPETANVSLAEKTVTVELEKIEYFSNIVQIDAQEIRFPANSWFDLNISAKNNLDSHLIAPITLSEVQGMLMEERDKLLLFEPLQQQQVGWRIRMNKNLAQNEYLSGTYKIVSLNTAIEKKLTVTSSAAAAEEAKIVLLDLLPLIKGKNLEIEITLQNQGGEKGTATVQVGDGKIVAKEITVEPLQKSVVAITIENFSMQPYAVSIKGPSLDYATTVTAKEGIAVVETKPNGSASQPGNPPLELPDLSSIAKIENILLIGIIIGVVVILFLLKELLSK
jgi:hypothetical protein